MPRNIVETLLGAAVLAVALGFLAWAYGNSSAGDPGGYSLHAKFDRIDGLDSGADVKVSGIKVGKVLAQQLDPATYRAQVTFSVRERRRAARGQLGRDRQQRACLAASTSRWCPAATSSC